MNKMSACSLAFLVLSLATGRQAFSQKVFSNWPRPSEIKVRLGAQSVGIPPGRLPGHGYPDMPISVVAKQPLKFLMVCGNDTYLWSGRTLGQSTPVAKVLSPGRSGSLDNNYAGISSVFHDKNNNRIIAFYHAEDSEGIGKVGINGVQGFYGRICVAESPVGNLNFNKIGAAITADQPKKLRAWETEGGPKAAWFAQGVGDPTVCVDSTGQYLLCVYNELSNRLKAGRGVQLCIARSPVGSGGRPGSWKKFYRGSFKTQGIGGHDTPVISAAPKGDAISPHIQYVSEWNRYLLVFSVGIFSEINGNPPRVSESGVYISTSKNATDWTKPIQIKRIFAIFINGQECLMHPFLVIDQVKDDEITGQLMYRYTHLWPREQGYLASTPIHISMNSQTGSQSSRSSMKRRESKPNKPLRQKLADTKWKNDYQGDFHWKKDGRLLLRGVERKWKVIGPNRVRVFFDKHTNDLIFNDDLTSFKQINGKETISGKRQ